MSHFEYVSVAVALLYALAFGRLLGGISPASDPHRRYWVHLTWVVTLLLVGVAQWWGLWGMRDVSWTAARFLFFLAIPGLFFVGSAVLMGEAPADVRSYRDHFFHRRVRFFSLNLMTAFIVGLTPWVYLDVPVLEMRPIHFTAAVLAALAVTGIASESAAVHSALVVIAFLLAAGSFVVSSPL